MVFSDEGGGIMQGESQGMSEVGGYVGRLGPWSGGRLVINERG